MNKFVLLFALLSLTLLPVASAAPRRRLKGSNSESTSSDDAEASSRSGFGKGPDKRECKFSSKDDEVKFSCKSNVDKDDKSSDEPESRGISLDPGSIRDHIQYKVKTDNKEGGVSVKVEYKQKYDPNDANDFFESTSTEFEINFNSIIEYAKPEDNEFTTEDDEAYDWDADEVIQTISFEDFDDISVVTNNDGDIISHFSVSSADQLINFNFTISQADFSEKITANNMKIDVRIVDFPWTRNDTYVALMSTVRSGMKIKMEYDDEAIAGSDQPRKRHKDSRVQIDFNDATEDVGFNPLGSYTWEDLAEVTPNVTASDANTIWVGDNGEPDDVEVAASRSGANATEVSEDAETVRVVATSPVATGDETFEMIAYSFVGSAAHGASEFYWDPEAGIFYNSAASSMSWFASVLSGVVVSGIMIIAL